MEEEQAAAEHPRSTCNGTVSHCSQTRPNPAKLWATSWFSRSDRAIWTKALLQALALPLAHSLTLSRILCNPH